jgi:hypothetical protein
MNGRRKRWIAARLRETTKEPVLIKPDTDGRALWWLPGQPKPDPAQIERGAQVAAEIDRGKTERGGWTRAQTAKWRVPWPLPTGWRQLMIKYGTLSYVEARNKELDEQCDQTRDRDRR